MAKPKKALPQAPVGQRQQEIKRDLENLKLELKYDDFDFIELRLSLIKLVDILLKG